ncbi:hypothetical protein BGW39_005757 [Mortierella sp. 14UC]|nr:hypothetical protein BGW39_005757 [Mortierella sp. 14UC]
MGKLTSLLKKKKSKGDDLGGHGTRSTMSGSSISVETSGIPAAPAAFVSVAPLSLSISTTEMTATELQAPFSLMDDIMDELAGTTPDTPQPSKPTDLSDFGLAFELSRQLELGASESKVSTVRNGGAPGDGNQKIGKLDQNSSFKDNAFLQQARSGASTTPVAAASGAGSAASFRSTYSNNNSNTSKRSSTSGNHNSSTTGSNVATATSTTTTTRTATPSYLRGRLQTKETEKLAAEAAAKLREASKKANAQLPSDDEGSDASDSDDSKYEPGLKKQQRLLQQQQYQHQLFLEQQQLLQQQLANNGGAGVKGSEAQEWEAEERKPVEINHGAVIDRMKDRHRALLQGAAAAAAREEYYEDYRDEYGMIPQQMQSPPAVMNYNMQYGMDPSMMYADDYRIQQQQQQMYFAQGGIPAHPHAHINATTYSHHSMNGVIHSYGYAHPPAPMPSYSSGMQMPVYQQQQQQLLQRGGSGRGTPMSHVPAGILQGRSNSVVSDGSVANSNSRRGSVQHSVVSSARVSEDSWNDTQQPQQQQHLHHHSHQHQLSMLALSTQKSANSDSGYSGVASDQGKNTFDDSLEDIQTAVGSEYEKTRAKLDDVTKVIEVLSIAHAAEKDSDGDDEDNDSNSDSDSDSDGSDDDEKSQRSDLEEQDEEDPESLKGSTAIDSIRHGFKGFATGSSSAPSNNGSNENEIENDNGDDSSDDDQPIILGRRNGARGPFHPTNVSAEEAAMMSQAQGMMPSPQQQQHQLQQQVHMPTSNAQMQYMAAAHTMGMYQQPIQGQMHMSYMPQQQQPPQPVMSPPPQHQQPLQQQQAYVPMGYQFPGPPQGVPSNMGHHHSYSVDRAPPNMMTTGPVARRVVGPGVPSKGHTSTGSSGSSIQSQYPIPATTLLYPLPRRSQSVRVRPQAVSPINNSNPTAGQGIGTAGAAGRGRSSLDFVRLPSSGYQNLIGGPMDGPEFSSAVGVGVGGPYIRGYGGEPLSPPRQQQQQQPLPPHLQQHHQQMQQQMEKQQMQQGYYMGNIMGGPLMSPPLPSQYGYMMQPDPYSAYPHQQILQAGRR